LLADPLNIGETSPETIGWFRHAEIKHGRVAMAAFVGYCVQANGVHFPWNLQAPIGPINSGIQTISFGDISAAGGPSDQWDALPDGAKLQILGAIAFLEMWGESSVALEMDGQQHYVRGGKPGYYPYLSGRFPHPVPLVPGLDSVGIPSYAGEPMAAFSSVNSALPYVKDMLAWGSPW
jgi:hypothetical protein